MENKSDTPPKIKDVLHDTSIDPKLIMRALSNYNPGLKPLAEKYGITVAKTIVRTFDEGTVVKEKRKKKK